MIRRLVLVTAMTVAGIAWTAPVANATDCSQNPKNCSGACHINWDARSPLELIECYA